MSEMLEGFIRAVQKTGSNVRGRGSYMVAQCPAHDDGNPSLSFSMGEDGVMFKCHAGCKKEAILEALGLTWPSVFKNNGKRTDGDSSEDDLWMPCRMDGCDGHKVAEYLYVDEDDNLLYAVARCSNKGQGCQGFRQWVPDSSKKYGKKWGVPSTVRRVPYRLPKVIKAAQAGRRIFVMEGEKDSERLEEDYPGEVATTMAQGAGQSKWKPEFCRYFMGASEVVIVADCDKAGLEYAEEVHRHMSKVVPKVKVVCSTLLDEGADFSDHRDYGFTIDELMVVPFEPVKKRPKMIIEVEEVDRQREVVFAGYSQTSVERSLVGSMLKYGHAYSVAPIDIVTDAKLKGIVQAVGRLAKRGRTVTPEMVAVEIEAISEAEYESILKYLLKIEDVAFSDSKKPEIAARILRERTMRTHIAAWLNAAIRRISNETIDLDDLLKEMRQALSRHAQEYVDLNAIAEPVGDAFSGDVIEEVILEEIQESEKKPKAPVKAKADARPARQAVVISMDRVAGQR